MRLLSIAEFKALKPRKGRRVHVLASEKPRIVWHLRYVGGKVWEYIGGGIG